MGASCGCNPGNASYTNDKTGRLHLLAKHESLNTDSTVPYTQMHMISPLELYPKLSEISQQWTQCADCNASNPKWAEICRGALVCIKCSSIHRSLGTDNSKIRSIEMDKWTENMVDNMSPSHIEFNKKWEFHVDKEYIKPSSSSSNDFRRKYIILKYIDTAFIEELHSEALAPVFDDTLGVNDELKVMDIQSSAGMIQYSGVIEIGDICVNNLPKTDIFHETDAYIVIKNSKYQSVKTNVIRNNCDPNWNEHLMLSVTEDEEVLIEIYDKNMIAKDELLCSAMFNVASKCKKDEKITLKMSMNLEEKHQKQKTSPVLTFVVIYTKMTT